MINSKPTSPRNIIAIISIIITFARGEVGYC